MSDKHSLEFNKLAAGFLLAGVLAMVAAFAADIFYRPMEAEKRGFAVEVPEGGDISAAAVAEEEVPILDLLVNASIENGEKEAKKRCAACHTFEAGAPHKTGPNLHGIIGKKHAAKAGYPYSSALQAVSGNYDYEAMNKWLKNPQAVAKGSKMILKLKKPEMRADIIKYLESLK